MLYILLKRKLYYNNNIILYCRKKFLHHIHYFSTLEKHLRMYNNKHVFVINMFNAIHYNEKKMT